MRRRRRSDRPRVDGDLVGMFADGDPGDGAQVDRVEDAAPHAAGPVGDEELAAVAGERHVIGPVPAGADLISFWSARSMIEIVPASTSSE